MRRRSKTERNVDALAQARRTALKLAEGYELTPIAAPMPLFPGEQCYLDAPVQLAQIGVDVTPVPQHLSAWGCLAVWEFGWPGLLLLSGALSSPQPNPPSWRIVDWGTLWITNQRFAVQGTYGWTDLWFSAIRSSEVDDDAIGLHVADAPRIRLRVTPAPVYFVVFWWLAYGRLPPFVQHAPASHDTG